MQNFKLKKNKNNSAVSQEVKYSEDNNQILNNFDAASDVTIEYGSLAALQEGVNDFIFISTPYSAGKNIYVAIKVTGISGETVCRSYLVIISSIKHLISNYKFLCSPFRI